MDWLFADIRSQHIPDQVSSAIRGGVTRLSWLLRDCHSRRAIVARGARGPDDQAVALRPDATCIGIDPLPSAVRLCNPSSTTRPPVDGQCLPTSGSLQYGVYPHARHARRLAGLCPAQSQDTYAPGLICYPNPDRTNARFSFGLPVRRARTAGFALGLPVRRARTARSALGLPVRPSCSLSCSQPYR